MSCPEKNSEFSGLFPNQEMSCLKFQPNLRAPLSRNEELGSYIVKTTTSKILAIKLKAVYIDLPLVVIKKSVGGTTTTF